MGGERLHAVTAPASRVSGAASQVTVSLSFLKHHARRQAGAWTWIVEGINPGSMAANPLAVWTAPHQFFSGVMILSSFLAGYPCGWLLSRSPVQTLLLLNLAGEIIIATISAILVAKVCRDWIQPVYSDQLVLTELTDSELAHGLWAPALLPVTRSIFAYCASMMTGFLMAVIVGMAKVPDGFLNYILLFLCPFLALANLSGTCAMLGPRITMASIRTRSGSRFGFHVGAQLVECYAALFLMSIGGAVLLIAIVIAFVVVRGNAGLVTLFLYMALLAFLKRGLSDAVVFALDSSFRAWLAERREGEPGP